MPTYSFRNKETGEEFDEIMSIAKLDQLLGTPPLGDPVRLGMK